MSAPGRHQRTRSWAAACGALAFVALLGPALFGEDRAPRAEAGAFTTTRGPSVEPDVSSFFEGLGEAPAMPTLHRLDAPPSIVGVRGHTPRRWSPWAARLDAHVELVTRRFAPPVLLKLNGRAADRPPVVSCPAQGPPAAS